MQEAEDKFGKKGKTNAALTLGIIGTALGAFSGNNGCGCGNNGILGGLFGGNNGNCLAERAMQTAMAQGEMSQNLAWNNRVQSLQDDIDLYTYINGRNLAINERIGNETQILTNQIWKGRVEDLQEKSGMYVDIITRDNAQNLRLCDELYKRREQDVQEKTDIFERLSTRINELEKKEAATAAALPLMFELNKVNAERYSDNCCCKSEKQLLVAAGDLQRQLDHKITGQLKYAYSDLCAPVPSISPLYCSPFTQYGTGMYAGQPFGTDLQNQYMQQLQVMQQAQQAQQKTQPILDEINREVGSLSVDEQNVLAKTQEYQMAKQTYEAGFMSFLGTKFSAEYVNSPDGKVAAENLLATIRKSKEYIQSQIKAKEEKVNTLLELMESDPEMKKRFDELMMNKTAK